MVLFSHKSMLNILQQLLEQEYSDLETRETKDFFFKSYD